MEQPKLISAHEFIPVHQLLLPRSVISRRSLRGPWKIHGTLPEFDGVVFFFLGPGFSNEQIFGCQRRRNETDRVFFLVLVVVVVVVAVVEIRILNRPSQSYEEIIRVTRQMKRASILECRNSTQTLTNAFSRTINCFVVELKLSQFLTSILAENLFFFKLHWMNGSIQGPTGGSRFEETLLHLFFFGAAYWLAMNEMGK